MLSRSRITASLQGRDFRLFWGANLVSSLGDGVFTVALALEALRLDQLPTGLAYVLAARTVPTVVLSLLGGIVADRVARRTALLAADVVRGLAVGLIAGLVLLHAVSLLWLGLMAVVFGVADAFAGPAFLALMPEIVPGALITQANALNSTSTEMAVNLVGPALGGVVVAAIGTGGCFLFDAATFAGSAAFLAGIGWRRRPDGPHSSMVREAVDGLRYITSRRWLLVLLVGAALANLTGLGPYTVLLPTLVRHVLHGSPVGLGLVYASAGAAGVLASLAVARLGEPRHLLETMWGAYGLSGLMVVALSQVPTTWAAAGCSAAAAGLVVYGDVLYFSRLQQSVPKGILGRVSSASFVMVMTLTPLGMVAGGLLAASLGTRSALLVSGTLSASCCLAVLVPGARDVGVEPS
ncbi:MAG: MFS transporter [Candidatus Dormibacteria bacterium]